MKRYLLTLVSICVVITAVQCAPRRQAPAEQLVQQFTGETETPRRSVAELEADYVRVIESLLPGMAADGIPDREEDQQTFERMCFHASRPGAEQERRALCLAMHRFVGASAPMPARIWLLRQLERMSGEESVDRLSSLLYDPDPHVAELARRCLQNNPSPAAGDTLRRALFSARKPAEQIAYMNALAARGEAKGTLVVAGFVESGDPAVAATAISALSRMGGTIARDALMEATHSPDQHLRTLAGSALIRMADADLASGSTRQAAATYRRLYESDMDQTVRTAAIRGYAEAAGPDALPLLLPIITGQRDAHLGAEAVRFAAAVPGEQVTKELAQTAATLIDRLEHRQEASAPAEDDCLHTVVILIDALARRADPAARETVLAACESDQPEVEEAALTALRTLGAPADVIYLARKAAAGRGPVREVVRDTLAAMPAAETDETMIAALQDCRESDVRAELVRGLSRRGSKQAQHAVMEALGDPEAQVRAAAFEGAGALATAEDLETLIGLLTAEDEESVAEAGVDAIVEVNLRQPDRSAAVQKVVGVLRHKRGRAKASLIRIIARVQDPQGLEALREALRQAETESFDAAVRALARWEDPAAMPDLLALARTAQEPVHRVLALRGYIRLLRAAPGMDAAERVERLSEAMKLATQAADRKLVLSALAETPHPDALRLARSLFDNDELRDEAALAVVGICKALSATDPASATEGLAHVQELDVSDNVREQARSAAAFIDRHRGYIATWLAAGPYHQEGIKAEQILATPFPPEENDPSVSWEPLAVTNSAEPWQFDLAGLYKQSNCCLYAKAEILSNRAQPALLEIGTDDGVKAWLNGEVVHDNNTFRGLTFAEDKIAVDLHEGRNLLMLKVSQGGGGWAFCCGLRAPDGGVLEGVTSEAK